MWSMRVLVCLLLTGIPERTVGSLLTSPRPLAPSLPLRSRAAKGWDHRAATPPRPRPWEGTFYPAPPDPTCATGLQGDGVCYQSQCGVCGGHGCGAHPGGAAGCCTGNILSSHRLCTSNPPPCIMHGGSGGGTWPPPDPTNKTVALSVSFGTSGVVHTVSDRYVSFNLDTGWVSPRDPPPLS
jgi:hypothetical protein